MGGVVLGWEGMGGLGCVWLVLLAKGFIIMPIKTILCYMIKSYAYTWLKITGQFLVHFYD